MNIQQAFDNFIISRRLADLSEKTITNYTGFIEPFISFVSADKQIEALHEADVSCYIATLINRPLSRASRATYIRHLKIFCKWLENTYGIQFNAKSIRVPKPNRRLVKIYAEEETAQIFDAIQTDTEWITKRNKCIIALMYDSGLRQAEVCTLKRKNVSFSDNTLVVCGKGNKERTVPLGRLTQRFMKAYFAMCPYTSDDVFVNRRGEPLTCDAVKHMVTKLADKLDFELSSHKLRHNFATNYCIDQYERYGQVDIYRLMYLMGHEDIKTTNRYLHLAMEVIAARNHISHLDKVAL